MKKKLRIQLKIWNNIIRNWRIKFTGFSKNMSIDDFIYRVNTLTENHLDGNFSLLCRHANALFEDKALKWYWRFHKQYAGNFNWNILTRALRAEYKVDYEDSDILDDMRKRKQRSNEDIDDFIEIISTMSDRLRNPMSDIDMCELVTRNLRTEIRYELLHLRIENLAHLRKEVRRHEKFMKEVKAKDARPARMRCHVTENVDEIGKVLESDEVQEVCAINVRKCWNCDKVGHSYTECMETRRIFCYGCGLLDTYKPTCPRCLKKMSGNEKTDVLRRYSGHPK